MINYIFKLVADWLNKLAKVTGLTYNQINVLVYYFFIPLSWFVLLDYYFSFYNLTIGFLIFIVGFKVGCKNFREFSDALFMKSVHFLNYFNRFGSNYQKSSVWICVSLPLLVYILIINLILRK
jgi:hypothetical protein